MSTELTLAIISLIAAPTLALIGVLFSSRMARKSAEKANVAAMENAKAAATNASSQQFSVLSEGFQATFERQDRELKELREGRQKDQKLIQEMDADLGILEEQNRVLIDHLELLEELVPNPPGAPPRPKLPEKAQRRRHGVE